MGQGSSLNQCLQQFLSKEEIAQVPSSFDIVGDILIFADFPKLKNERRIAECFLKHLKQVKVVCKKTKQYSGVFRTPKLKILAGEQRKETTHRENGCAIRLNVETCYFSPRMSNERKRIASLVVPKEKILVMFSGVGPYPLVIAKNAKPNLVYGVEKNPKAHKYAEENLRTNKAKTILLFRGDVKTIVPKLKTGFDRVVMPHPKDAESFLNITLPRVKKGGTLHYYDFAREAEFKEVAEKVVKACRQRKRKCRILKIVKCGQYSPRVYRVCVDARIF